MNRAWKILRGLLHNLVHLDEVLGNLVFKKLFTFWERLGFHVTPCHFYQPIPVLRDLPSDLWDREPSTVGLELNPQAQSELLRTVCAPFKEEYDQFGALLPDHLGYYPDNGMFGQLDGDLLYSMVRHYKPRRIVEIGSGWSTCVSLCAARRNGGNIRLTAIEPYPSKRLLDLNGPELTLIRKKVQDVELDLFDQLEENDILFVDSSHVARCGSDVCRILLEIFPRLRPGVVVHIHDIFLPYEYCRSWLYQEKWFWNESYLLHAFLLHNSHFEILFAVQWMMHKFPQRLGEMFRRPSGQSFWIRRRL